MRGRRPQEPVLTDAQLLERCGVYRCSDCGGVFASVAATGVASRLYKLGVARGCRAFTVLGGKKICARCAAKRRPRRPRWGWESLAAQGPDATGRSFGGRQ